MNKFPILPPDDDLDSFPSMPTMHGGDPNALGRIDHYGLLGKLAKKPKDRFPSCTESVVALSSTTEHTEDDAGRALSPSAPQNDGASRPGEQPNAAELEADVLRRKVVLARTLAGVLRGGSYWLISQGCRSANRSGIYPDFLSGSHGFRLVAF